MPFTAQAGGFVILMRHANSPGDQRAAVGLTDGCVLQPGRGLDAAGFFQARLIGEIMKVHDIPIGAGFTSDMCRCWDTARLVAAGAPVAAAPELKTTDPAAIAAFKDRVASLLAEAPEANILLVTHSNIVPLYSNWLGEGEIPSGDVLFLDPKTWEIATRFSVRAPNAEPSE